MNYTLLSPETSGELRQRFLCRFTDKTSVYHQKLLRLYPYPEGMRCGGYIWELLCPYTLICPSAAMELLTAKDSIYVLQDLRRDPNEHRRKFPFPRDRIAQSTGAALAEHLKCRENYPPEMNFYIFDDSFEWYIAFTNEYEKHVYEKDGEAVWDCLCLKYDLSEAEKGEGI